MILSNAIICTQVESTPKGLNLNGVFSEIVKDPIPSAIDCSVVITLERTTTDTPMTTRQIRVELIHRPTGRFLLLGHGAVSVPDPATQVVIKTGNLPLNGLGDYYVRVTDTTDSAHPDVLAEKLLFTVKPSSVTSAT